MNRIGIEVKCRIPNNKNTKLRKQSKYKDRFELTHFGLITFSYESSPNSYRGLDFIYEYQRIPKEVIDRIKASNQLLDLAAKLGVGKNYFLENFLNFDGNNDWIKYFICGDQEKINFSSIFGSAHINMSNHRAKLAEIIVSADLEIPISNQNIRVEDSCGKGEIDSLMEKNYSDFLNMMNSKPYLNQIRSN